MERSIMPPSDLPSDTTRKIKVVEYDPQWPELFELEAKWVKQALGSNCIIVHQFLNSNHNILNRSKY
jgi:hypothetical protein